MSKPIPHDLIEEILTYLPVKSLLRFKCVSKRWNSLISSSKFAKSHLRRVQEENNINQHSKILLSFWPIACSVDFEAASDADNYQAVLELSYPEAFVGPNYSYMKILGSCNGLVCLINNRFGIILWNPSTRVSKILPKPGIPIGDISFSGLGYDDSTDDYKLIVANKYNTTDERETGAEIFTLRSDSWKRIQDLGPIFMVLTLGIYFNQSLHWLGWKENGTETEIFTFDIAEERFKQVLKLSNGYEIEDAFDEMYLGMSKNSLCVFGECEEYYSLSTNAPWIQLFEVPHDGFDGDFPLCVTNKGKVVLFDPLSFHFRPLQPT